MTAPFEVRYRVIYRSMKYFLTKNQLEKHTIHASRQRGEGSRGKNEIRASLFDPLLGHTYGLEIV